MADRDEMDEYTNTKRVRLSSDASLAQNTSYSDDKDKFEPEKDFRLQFTATGEGDNSKKPSSESTSREQHVGHGGQERRQIDDFPTYFSVEEGLDDIYEHHYQPVAGNYNLFALEYPQIITSTRFLYPPFCFCSSVSNGRFEISLLKSKLAFLRKSMLLWALLGNRNP